MRRSKFLRALLVLPIAAPLAAIPAVRAGIELGGLLPLLSLALVVGGGPYLIFLLLSLWLLRKSEPERLVRFFYVAPIWYLIPLNLGLAAFSLLAEGEAPEGWWIAFLYYSAYGVGVGYFYVCVALAAYWLASRVGWFDARRITNE